MSFNTVRTEWRRFCFTTTTTMTGSPRSFHADHDRGTIFFLLFHEKLTTFGQKKKKFSFVNVGGHTSSRWCARESLRRTRAYRVRAIACTSVLRLPATVRLPTATGLAAADATVYAPRTRSLVHTHAPSPPPPKHKNRFAYGVGERDVTQPMRPAF